VAKLIAHGPHRKLALAKLDEALARTEALGMRTNLRFLRALVMHADVQRGRVDTELVSRDFEHLVPAERDATPAAIALAAAAIADGAKHDAGPWGERGAFRIGDAPHTTVVLHDGPREHIARIAGAGPYRMADHTLSKDASEPHAWTLDGAPAAVAVDDARVWVGYDGRSFELETEPPPRSRDAALAAEVAAPMPGVVIGASARADQRVRRGDLLFVVEAMKMEPSLSDIRPRSCRSRCNRRECRMSRVASLDRTRRRTPRQDLHRQR
jgi:acetyl-CoA/propionyl-CoA carboxylase biotin carboxyl carrier protein